MDNKDKDAVNTPPAAAPEKTEIPAVTTEDAEARIAVLESEKAKAIEEASNWKLAALKNKNKGTQSEDESEEDRIARIVQEKLSETKIAQIDTEKEVLLKKLAKENKELKLAQLNKNGTPPAAIGSHSETVAVKDTAITPEQMAAFKARGWSDKDIERYKKNYQKYSGR